VSSESPELSIIIVSYNTRDMLRDCLQSVINTTEDISIETIVVDNDSADGSAQMVEEEFPEVQLIANNANLGFAAANNQAYDVCSGSYVLMLNPDVLVRNNAIRRVVKVMKADSSFGAAGCKTLNSDGTIQMSVWRFPSVLGILTAGIGLDGVMIPERRPIFYRGQEIVDVDWVQGSFLMVRREAVVGERLLDERYFIYGEEKDLCMHLHKAGWRVVFIPHAEIVHFGGQSAALNPTGNWCELQRSQLLFFRKHYTPLYDFALRSMLFTVLGLRTLGYGIACLAPTHRNTRFRERARLFGEATRWLWHNFWSSEPQSTLV
jgi:GT2 family glycosyltransferase